MSTFNLFRFPGDGAACAGLPFLLQDIVTVHEQKDLPPLVQMAAISHATHSPKATVRESPSTDEVAFPIFCCV